MGLPTYEQLTIAEVRHESHPFQLLSFCVSIIRIVGNIAYEKSNLSFSLVPKLVP